MAGSIRDGAGHRAYRRKREVLRRQVARDGLPCWICGEPIDVTLDASDRMSFTADHFEALANGGHLVRNELRPAHRACNSRRGNAADPEIWEAT